MGATVMLIFFAPLLAFYAVLSMFNPGLADALLDKIPDLLETPAAHAVADFTANVLYAFVQFLEKLNG